MCLIGVNIPLFIYKGLIQLNSKKKKNLLKNLKKDFKVGRQYE